MKTIVALPGEGIGVEVVEATCEVLTAASVPVKILTPPQITAPGSPVPDETKRICRDADAVLFGAAGPATTRVVGWFGRGLERYRNGRFAVKIVTRDGAVRIARFACELALRRKLRGRAGKVTCVTKSNVLPQTDGLFHQTVEETVRTYPDLTFEHFHVDDAARRIVRFPSTLDVVLCMNQYGDILSDVAGEVAGGLGVAPSGNFGDNGWAYFESVHGSAPDIAGRGIANPTGTLLSAALMLEHLGLSSEAARLETAVARVYRDGKALTPDQRGSATTKHMADAVLAAYRNQ